MNMTSGATFSGWNRRKVNRLLAAGVASGSISLAIAFGTSNIWESGRSNSTVGDSASTFARATEPITVSSAEDWGLVAEAFIKPRQQSATLSGDEFLGLGQPGEAAQSSETAVLLDPTDLGSIGAAYIDSPAPTQFSTAADAAFAAESARTQPAAIVLGENLGIGQPGEGVAAEEAMLFDPTDLGSLGIESASSSQASARAEEDFGGVYLPYVQSEVALAAPRQFGTAADAVYQVEGLVAHSLPTAFAGEYYFGLGQPSERVIDGHFGTTNSSVSAIEGDYLGVGQPGEGSVITDPMLGTMVGQVYVIEDVAQLP